MDLTPTGMAGGDEGIVGRRPGWPEGREGSDGLWLGCRTVGSTYIGRQFGERTAQLSSDFNGGQPVTPNELGMTLGECRRQGEGQQHDESDGGQTTVGDRLSLAVVGDRLGTMPAGVQETVLESPILGEIIPAVVFLFPAIMTEATD